MTVRELIEKLKEMPGDFPVTYPSEDIPGPREIRNLWTIDCEIRYWPKNGEDPKYCKVVELF